MKSIVCVNFDIPTVDSKLDYGSRGSLRDYDIVVFSPKLPWYERVSFSAGGSCISIEDTRRFNNSASHWSRELADAISAGKTIFVILSEIEEDQGAFGSSTTSKTTSYQTGTISSYSALPVKLALRNASGRTVVVKDPIFKGLYESVREITEYQVIFEPEMAMRRAFTAKDGTGVGGVVTLKDRPGSMVVLPHFSFDADELTELSEEDEEVWNEKALRASKALVGQMVAIDRALKSAAELTPPPDWLTAIRKPTVVQQLETAITEVDAQIEKLENQKKAELARLEEVLEYSNLLYENGKTLELAIEKVLRLLGYTVETLRVGDLEIDHVIVGPSGRRMIGESEGKDSSPIDITKFRLT